MWPFSIQHQLLIMFLLGVSFSHGVNGLEEAVSAVWLFSETLVQRDLQMIRVVQDGKCWGVVNLMYPEAVNPMG